MITKHIRSIFIYHNPFNDHNCVFTFSKLFDSIKKQRNIRQEYQTKKKQQIKQQNQLKAGLKEKIIPTNRSQQRKFLQSQNVYASQRGYSKQQQNERNEMKQKKEFNLVRTKIGGVKRSEQDLISRMDSVIRMNDQDYSKEAIIGRLSKCVEVGDFIRHFSIADLRIISSKRETFIILQKMNILLNSKDIYMANCNYLRLFTVEVRFSKNQLLLNPEELLEIVIYLAKCRRYDSQYQLTGFQRRLPILLTNLITTNNFTFNYVILLYCHMHEIKCLDLGFKQSVIRLINKQFYKQSSLLRSIKQKRGDYIHDKSNRNINYGRNYKKIKQKDSEILVLETNLENQEQFRSVSEQNSQTKSKEESNTLEESYTLDESNTFQKRQQKRGYPQKFEGDNLYNSFQVTEQDILMMLQCHCMKQNHMMIDYLTLNYFIFYLMKFYKLKLFQQKEQYVRIQKVQLYCQLMHYNQYYLLKNFEVEFRRLLHLVNLDVFKILKYEITFYKLFTKNSIVMILKQYNFNVKMYYNVIASAQLAMNRKAHVFPFDKSEPFCLITTVSTIFIKCVLKRSYDELIMREKFENLSVFDELQYEYSIKILAIKVVFDKWVKDLEQVELVKSLIQTFHLKFKCKLSYLYPLLDTFKSSAYFHLTLQAQLPGKSHHAGQLLGKNHQTGQLLGKTLVDEIHPECIFMKCINQMLFAQLQHLRVDNFDMLWPCLAFLSSQHQNYNVKSLKNRSYAQQLYKVIQMISTKINVQEKHASSQLTSINILKYKICLYTVMNIILKYYEKIQKNKQGSKKSESLEIKQMKSMMGDFQFLFRISLKQKIIDYVAFYKQIIKIRYLEEISETIYDLFVKINLLEYMQTYKKNIEDLNLIYIQMLSIRFSGLRFKPVTTQEHLLIKKLQKLQISQNLQHRLIQLCQPSINVDIINRDTTSTPLNFTCPLIYIEGEDHLQKFKKFSRVCWVNSMSYYQWELLLNAYILFPQTANKQEISNYLLEVAVKALSKQEGRFQLILISMIKYIGNRILRPNRKSLDAFFTSITLLYVNNSYAINFDILIVILRYGITAQIPKLRILEILRYIYNQLNIQSFINLRQTILHQILVAYLKNHLHLVQTNILHKMIQARKYQNAKPPHHSTNNKKLSEYIISCEQDYIAKQEDFSASFISLGVILSYPVSVYASKASKVLSVVKDIKYFDDLMFVIVMYNPRSKSNQNKQTKAFQEELQKIIFEKLCYCYEVGEIDGQFYEKYKWKFESK